MRLPEGLRGPAEFPRGSWIAGTVVMVIVIFVALVMPWHEVGERVFESELPRPRLHNARWCYPGCINTGDFFVLSVDRHGAPGGHASVAADNETSIPPDALDAWIQKRRDQHGGRGAALLIRAHRRAPWSSVARVLESAVRTRHEDIRLQVGGWNFLELVLDTPRQGEEAIVIAALPLGDPAGTLAATREREKARSRGPIIQLAFAGDPDVESVLHALECYAGDDIRVRLAVRG